MVLQLGKFEQAPSALRDHVLNDYLPSKLSKMWGFRNGELNDDTIIHVSRNYKPSEGKLVGKWESFTKLGIVDLRVDLQPRNSAGFTDHVGSNDYANFAVQFGANKSLKKSSKARPGDLVGGQLHMQQIRPGSVHSQALPSALALGAGASSERISSSRPGKLRPPARYVMSRHLLK